MYFCEISVCFRSYLFVREPFEEKLNVFAAEARPDTIVKFELNPRTVSRVACAQKKLPAGVNKTIPRGFCMRPYFISIRTYDSSCFLHGAQPAQTAGNFRTLCAGNADDRQTTTAAVQRATSWLRCYTTCCIAHSCFSRTLGSVTEDRAGTVNYCLLCVTHATRSAGLLLCCAAAILASGSSSMAAVPLWQADERATVRTHLVLLSSFTYDMYYACCCCCCLALPCLLWSYTTRCIFLLLLPSISIPNHTLIMHQVKSITKNRLYKHNGGRTIQHRLLSGGSREGALRLLQGAERAAVVRVTSTCGAVL